MKLNTSVKEAKMFVDHIDHIVMTCHSVESTKNFYKNILNMKVEVFGDNRFALRFGNQKINLHQYGKEFESKVHLLFPVVSIYAL